MSGRYTQLFALTKNLHAAGVPVLVRAGALLKDNETGLHIAQLKLCNLSDKPVAAVMVRLHLFDITGNPLGEPVEFDYLDLNVSRDGEFGSQIPIRIPEKKARSYTVAVTDVVFTDKSLWHGGDEVWEALPAAEPLTETIQDPELLKEYRLRFGKKSSFQPRKIRDLWYCTCGALNREGEDCHVCGGNLTEMLTVDMAELAQRKDARLEEEQKEEARQKAASAARKKKTALLAAAAAAVVCVIVAAILVVNMVVIPNGEYGKAQALMEAGEYEAAIEAFEALDGYKDSRQKIQDCRTAILDGAYDAAAALMEAGEYEAAIEAFEALDGYRDSQQQIGLCANAMEYDEALALKDAEDYEAALAILEELGDFRDSRDLAAQLEALILEQMELESRVVYHNFYYGYDFEGVKLEVYECRVYPRDNGYSRVEVDFKTVQHLWANAFFYTVDNSEEAAFEYYAEEPTTGARETLAFEVETALLEQTDMIYIFFQKEIGGVNSGINIIMDEYSLRTTDGHPVGQVVELADYGHTGPVTIHGITMQALDNGMIRFTLDCDAPADRYISFYEPPNGDRFMFISMWTTSGGRETITVDVRRELLEGVKNVNFNLFNGPEEVCRIYISDLPPVPDGEGVSDTKPVSGKDRGK